MPPDQPEPNLRTLPGLSADWPHRVADRIVSTVCAIRAATDRPAANLARRVVYGLVIVVLAILMFVLGVIGLVRLIDLYLPGEVWATYVLLGAFFGGIGLLLWARRPRRAASRQAL
ncbi:MAG: hypothetical protein OXH20_03525 [bacterium]|nr:hypothetical protein [bacterium]MXZ29785.1 hypothetical protein [Acidimicrobiia bacterium]MDE0669026.1 hypothetical protein [bacterium]MYB24911.1 hypothetical protein [Acidimicrobiia bacterium]MYE68303.1 hypothetical protein [Acidimicrobiia bacterium]